MIQRNINRAPFRRYVISEGAAAITAAGISAAGAATSAGIQAGNISGHSHQNRKYQRWALQQQLAEQERARQYNERQAQIAREWQEQYYERYQSPEAMVRQYREAGLNPYGAVGAISSFDAASASQQPQIDPVGSAAPYAQYGQGMSTMLTNQQTAYNDAISNGFNQLATMAQQYLQIEKQSTENALLKQQLGQMSSIMDIFNKPVDQELLKLLPGLEPVIQKLRGGMRANVDNGETQYFPNARVGDLLSLANFLGPLMDLNEKPSGNFPTSVDSALYKPAFKAIAKHGHSYDSMPALLAAFDAVHGSSLSQISQNELSRWSADWTKTLRQRGINPDGNDFFNTALRVLYANGNNADFDSLLHALGSTMGSASRLVGSLVDLPKQYLDSVQKWNLFGKKSKK